MNVQTSFTWDLIGGFLVEKINTRRIKLTEVQESRFYQLPKFLVHDPHFKKLSGDAKILYSVLRDRHELSVMNNWVDENGDVFIYYTRNAMMEDLGLSNKTVSKYMNELKQYGLIDEVRQGLNKPNRIYICTLDLDTQWKCKKYTSGSVKSTLQEVKKVHTNDTNISDTNISDNTTTHVVEDSNESVVAPSPTEKKSTKPLKKESTKQTKVVNAIESANKQTIESKTKLNLTPYQCNTVSKWDEDRLDKAIEIFNEQDGQFFALLLKIYNGKAIITPFSTISKPKVSKFNEMDSRDDWDFDEIERLEREYIEKKLSTSNKN